MVPRCVSGTPANPRPLVGFRVGLLAGSRGIVLRGVGKYVRVRRGVVAIGDRARTSAAACGFRGGKPVRKRHAGWARRLMRRVRGEVERRARQTRRRARKSETTS
jgi:hypothetical protein